MNREARLIVVWFCSVLAFVSYTLVIFQGGVAVGEERMIARWNAARYR